MALPAPHMGIFQPEATYRRTAFAAAEAVDIPLPGLSRTTTAGARMPLHPIMQKAYTRYITNGTAQQSAMEQPIRLASKILLSGLLHPFFHIFTNNPVPWNYNGQTGHQFTAAQVDFNLQLTRRQRANIDDLLRIFARHVTFHSAPAAGPNSVSYGYCIEMPNRVTFPAPMPGLAHLAKPALYGVQSQIWMNQYWYQELHAALAKNTDHAWIYYLSFTIANTLLHEITHAFRNFMLAGFVPDQPYFGDRTLAVEVGFELEKYLWGGYVCEAQVEDYLGQYYALDCYTSGGVRSELRNPMVVWEWPSPMIEGVYAAVGTFGYGTRGRDLSAQRPLNNAWRMSMGYIRGLFTEASWGRYGPLGNAPFLTRDRFVMRKSLGHTFRPSTSDPNNVVPIGSVLWGNDARYVPIGYQRDQLADLRPDPAVISVLNGTQRQATDHLRYTQDGSEANPIVF